MLRAISAILLVAVFAADADACFRCGRFGRRCRFRAVQKVVVPHVQKVVQQQVAVPQQAVNISNVYPQGNTQYTLGQAAAVYALNPDLAVTAAARVADNAIATLTSSISAGLAGNADVAQIAKLQVATEHLRTAMGTSEPSSVTLKITQSGGGINVEEVHGDKESGESLTDAARQSSVLGSVCAKCHGTSLASPKGGLYLDAGHPLTPDAIVSSLDMVRQDKMPPGNPLTDQQKATLMEEMLGLKE